MRVVNKFKINYPQLSYGRILLYYLRISIWWAGSVRECLSIIVLRNSPTTPRPSRVGCGGCKLCKVLS